MTRRTRYGLFALAAAAILVLVIIVWDREAVLRWKEHANPWLFFAAMAVFPAFGVPLSPLFIVAGATFGNRVGLLGSLAAVGFNFALCYAISVGLRGPIQRLLARFHYQLPDFGAQERSPVRFALAVKVTPGLPAFAKNYILGVGRVPFGIYLAVSMAITGTYAVLLVMVGESLFDHRFNRGVVLAACAAVLALGAVIWWRKRRRPRSADPRASPSKPET